MPDFDDLFLVGALEPPGSTIQRALDYPPSASDLESLKELGLGSQEPVSIQPNDIEDFEILVHRIVSEVVAHLQPWLETRTQQSVHLSPAPSTPMALTQQDAIKSSAAKEVAQLDQEKIHALQGQIDLLQLRQEKLHQQLNNYEAEIDQLHQEKELLEQTILELPEIYRRKFTERMKPIRDRIEAIQEENYQLRIDVHELNCQLRRQKHVEDLEPPRWQIRLPQLPKIGRR